jgi:hypothetical protein
MDAFGWLGKSFYWIQVYPQAGLGGAACRKFSSTNPTFETESRCPTNMTAKS